MRALLGIMSVGALSFTWACQGEEGPLGAQGLPADDGQPGVDGLRGPKGELGPQGPQGPQGEPGLDADDNQIAFRLASLSSFAESVGNFLAERHQDLFVGPVGPQGEQGLPGPVGRAGPEGERGAQGDRGEQGPRGPMGFCEVDYTDCQIVQDSIRFNGRITRTHQIFCDADKIRTGGSCDGEETSFRGGGVLTGDHPTSSSLGGGYYCKARPDSPDVEGTLVVSAECCVYREREE
jgi:hypothetical protein